MNYLDLRKGDKTPAVGVLQKLLNRGGSNISVDGEFGKQTEQAVKAFEIRAREANMRTRE